MDQMDQYDIYNAHEARLKLHRLIESVVATNKPIVIKTEEDTALLVSEEVWITIQDTLSLLATLGLPEQK